MTRFILKLGSFLYNHVKYCILNAKKKCTFYAFFDKKNLAVSKKSSIFAAKICRKPQKILIKCTFLEIGG